MILASSALTGIQTLDLREALETGQVSSRRGIQLSEGNEKVIVTNGAIIRSIARADVELDRGGNRIHGHRAPKVN